MLHDRLVDVVPMRTPCEHEIVETARKPKRRVPGRVRADDLGDARVVRELAPQAGVERRPPLRELRLRQEDVCLIPHRRLERMRARPTGRLR